MAEQDVLDAIADLSDKVDDCIDKVDDCIDKVDDLKDQIENLEMVQYAVCTQCQGTGEVIASYDEQSGPGAPITCPRCNGAGKIAIGSAVEKDD